MSRTTAPTHPAPSPLTRIHELERRLERAERLLHRAARHEVSSRIAGAGAHELRNHLTGLQGHARLLLEEKPIGDPDRDSLLRITRASEAVVDLAARFRAVLGPSPTGAERLDVKEEIELTAPLIRTLAGEWVAVDLDYLESARVSMSRGDFRQALMGLAAQAVERMSGGGMLHISLERDRAVADDGSVSRWAVLTVADTGEPPTSEQLAASLDPLGSDDVRGRRIRLGLWTARSIVERLGGRVTIQGEEGGCRVRVHLPLEGRESSSVPTGCAEEPTDRARHILVVDDDDAVREVAVKILSRFGYRIDQANGGRAALDLLEGMSSPPDLLLSDIVMPEMNGRELSEKVRARHPDLPVLFMSAYTEDEVILHGIRVAEVNFLPKPFTLEGLADAVRQALVRSGALDC